MHGSSDVLNGGLHVVSGEVVKTSGTSGQNQYHHAKSDHEPAIFLIIPNGQHDIGINAENELSLRPACSTSYKCLTINSYISSP